MGVAGLWDVLRPAGQQISLVKIAVEEGYQNNAGEKRGFRVGIDASIWFYHATHGREGENPELRTLFFRLAKLLQDPFLPLFVFDGPDRPEFKRGKRISGKGNWMENGMKNLIEAFGFEWRQAPGEAEAELAYLNRIGIIDAVLTDDGDTFLFGAKVVIRNPSNNLSGNKSNPNKNADGRDDGKHTMMYRARDIAAKPDIGLTRGGFILMGMLCGGDYHQTGLEKCGKQTALALARCGLGDELVQAVQGKPSSKSSDAYAIWEAGARAKLATWRHALRDELASNSKGLIGRKLKSLSNAIPPDFPSLEILLSYTHPTTSESRGWKVNDTNMWLKDPSLGEIAHCCEKYFEWGIKEVIIKRFRTVIWPGACLRILRREALYRDGNIASDDVQIIEGTTTPRKRNQTSSHPTVETPSKIISRHLSRLSVRSPGGDTTRQEEIGSELMVKIHSTRRHASTDNLLECRVEISPGLLVKLAESGIQGIRRAEDVGIGAGAEGHFEDVDEENEYEDIGTGRSRVPKPPPDPYSHIRVWLPACMMEYVQPELMEAFEQKKAAKIKVGKVKKSGPPKELNGQTQEAKKSGRQAKPQEVSFIGGGSNTTRPKPKTHSPSRNVSSYQKIPAPSETSRPSSSAVDEDTEIISSFNNSEGSPGVAVSSKKSVLSLIEGWKPRTVEPGCGPQDRLPESKRIAKKTYMSERGSGKTKMNSDERTKVMTAMDIFNDDPVIVPDHKAKILQPKAKSRIASVLSSSSEPEEVSQKSPRKSLKQGLQHTSPTKKYSSFNRGELRSASPTPLPKHRPYTNLSSTSVSGQYKSRQAEGQAEYIEISSSDDERPTKANKQISKASMNTRMHSPLDLALLAPQRNIDRNCTSERIGRKEIRNGGIKLSNEDREVIDLVSP